MKIVIDISAEDFEKVKCGRGAVSMMRRAIIHGAPLPKGHGRLIDADAFIARLEDASKRQKYKKLLIDDCLTVDDVFKAIIESLQNKGLANGDTPTIIEADTESEDKHTEERTKTHACDCISRNAIIKTLNEMDRFIASELTLCKNNNKFPQNEVFIVDDVYEQIAEELPSVEPKRKAGECKDCKYFEYDSVAKVDGIPLIVAHEICNRWGNGCKTNEDGYCFLYEPQESEDNNGTKHRENGTEGC